ncbi:MAG TPA: CHAT domain-containing protein [Blastocatellia bacterium]|nr:CHAT domain-containing protein [Blastocatellia bacterium]
MVEADEKTIRQYLLGEMAEAEMSHFEERLMTDDELFEMLRVVEDELIDEAATHELSAQEQARFDSYFLAAPDRRARLELSLALHEHVHPVPEPMKEDDPAKIANLKKTNDPAVVDFLAAKQATNQVPHPSHGRSRRIYMGLAAAAAVILIAIGLWLDGIIPPRPSSDVSKGLQALNQAYREQRPTEARITGLSYAPLPSITRGGQEERFDRSARNRAERILQDEADAHPGVGSYHALGRLYLAEHRLDEAIEQFDKALSLSDKDAQLHNDYAVALMEMGKAKRQKDALGKSLEEFARALEHLDRALALDATLLEALFNRALCHEYMQLYGLAKEDWKAYLEKDSDSAWANEARQRLKQLEERPRQSAQASAQIFDDFIAAYQSKDDGRAWEIICRNRDWRGSFIANKLIDEYLDLAVSGRRDEADERIKLLSYTGDLEYRQARDRFLADLCGFYKAATAAQLKDVVQARRLIKAGHESYSNPKPDLEEAISLYTRAKAGFERSGDVLEVTYIAYWLGNCYLQQSKAEAGLSLFESLGKTCERTQYQWLLVQSLIARANANTYTNDLSMAIRHTNRALRLSKEMGDPIGYARTLFQLADEYRFVDNFQKAVELHLQDLLLAQVYFPQPVQLWRSYFSISRSLDGLNLYTAAIDFQKEALNLATEAEAPRLICRSHNYLAIILAKSGNYAEAANHVGQALEIGDSFPDRRVRIENTANCFLQLGAIYRKSGEFGKAADVYDRAIGFYDELKSWAFSYVARKDKLLCCLAQGQCPSVEQEMETVLKLFEQHRAKILEESNRSTFFDAEQSIYDLAMEFEYARGEAKKAFDYSERCHARSLHDLISTKVDIIGDAQNPDISFGAPSQPMSAETVQELMPEQSQIVQYAVLKDSLLIWVLSKDKTEVFSSSQRISAEELNNRVRGYLQMVTTPPENNAAAILSEAADLYELLIKPIEKQLDGSKQLCIVADKILNYLPFESLFSPASGKYFIEEHAFMVSPSSTMFVRCSQAAREKAAGGSEPLLSVGNPYFDGQAFPELADLTSATKEAKGVAACYPFPRLVVEAAATKSRVKGEMEKAEVIHLATHAIIDPWNPMRSKLLLAKDPASIAAGDADSILQAYEIYRLNLTRAKLVVLSACQTGAEKYYGGEGVVGLARPFIAKRVPLVVASLWPVNSDSTAELMIRFHRYRKSEGSTVAALRLAQIDMLRDQDGQPRSPYYWAAFVAIGGYASY